jgi:hypothetical protein
MPRRASTEKAVRHYVGFVNPRTKQRETIWFSTKRRRADFVADLAADFGSIQTEEWEEGPLSKLDEYARSIGFEDAEQMEGF